MMTHHKYYTVVEDIMMIDMPRGAGAFQFASINGGRQITLWAFVDTEAPIVKTKFAVFKTGCEVSIPVGFKKMDFIQTVIGSTFIWHIYLLGE